MEVNEVKRSFGAYWLLLYSVLLYCVPKKVIQIWNDMRVRMMTDFHYQLNFPFKNTLIWSSGLVSTGGFIFLHTASRLLWTEKPSPHTPFVSSNVCTQYTTKLKTSGICLGLTHCAFLNQSSSQLRKGKSQIHSPSYDKPISCTSQQSLNNRKAHCRVRL